MRHTNISAQKQNTAVAAQKQNTAVASRIESHIHCFTLEGLIRGEGSPENQKQIVGGGPNNRGGLQFSQLPEKILNFCKTK